MVQPPITGSLAEVRQAVWNFSSSAVTLRSDKRVGRECPAGATHPTGRQLFSRILDVHQIERLTQIHHKGILALTDEHLAGACCSRES